MAVTTLFDSTVVGSLFDGTKTIAQLGLTDVAGTASIAGGKLSIPGTATGWVSSLVQSSAVQFGRTTITLLASDLGTANLILHSGRQASGAEFLWLLSSNSVSCFQYDAVNGLVSRGAGNPAGASYDGTSGTVTVVAETYPGASGSLSQRLTVTAVNGVSVFTEDNLMATPLAPGSFGVGARSGTVLIQSLKLENTGAALSVIGATTNLDVAIGDGLMWGQTTSNPPATASSALLQGVLNTGGLAWTTVNRGDNNRSVAGMDTQFAADIAPFLAQSYAVKTVRIMAGMFDLIGGATPAAALVSLTSIVTKAKAAGATVFIETLLPYASQQAAINTLNASIKSGATGAQNVVDLTTVPELTDPTNTTYFNAGIYLTDAGQSKKAGAEIIAYQTLPPNVSVASFSADGRTLTVGLSLPITNAAASDFVLSNAAGFSATSLSADGRTLTLSLRRRVLAPENPTLTYAGTNIVGTNQKPIKPFTALAVTNNSTRRAFGPPAYLNVAYPGFTWPAVAGATGYRLYQNGILVYDTVNAAGVNTATSFTDPAATDGRPIDQPTFTVSAYDGTGEGPQSGTPDGTAAALFTQGVTSVTLTDNAVVNGQTVQLSGPQRVVVNDVRYDVPVGVPVLLPNSIKSVLQNANLIA